MTAAPVTCKGTRKDGRPCQSTVVDATGRCFVHGRSPTLVAEAARAAGQRSGEVRREQAKSVYRRRSAKLATAVASIVAGRPAARFLPGGSHCE